VTLTRIAVRVAHRRVAAIVTPETADKIRQILDEVAGAAETAMDWADNPMTGESRNKTPWTKLQKSMAEFESMGPIQAGDATVEVVGETVDEDMSSYNVQIVIKHGGEVIYDGEFINDDELEKIFP
jgi:hypothetical protein